MSFEESREAGKLGIERSEIFLPSAKQDAVAGAALASPRRILTGDSAGSDYLKARCRPYLC